MSQFLNLFASKWPRNVLELKPADSYIYKKVSWMHFHFCYLLLLSGKCIYIYVHITSNQPTGDIMRMRLPVFWLFHGNDTKLHQCTTLPFILCPHRRHFFLLSAVMDITDIIKGKLECDEEKQFFIPFFPYVLQPLHFYPPSCCHFKVQLK